MPFPTKAFNAGNTRPLKLRVGCGGINVTESLVEPPRIVGISEAIRGPIDITFLGLNADNLVNPNELSFTYNELIGGP